MVLQDGSLCQGLNDRYHVNNLWRLGELVASTEINMLPRHGGDVCEQIFLWLGWPVRLHIRTSGHAPKDSVPPRGSNRLSDRNRTI
jgi:hypothetical protein